MNNTLLIARPGAMLKTYPHLMRFVLNDRELITFGYVKARDGSAYQRYMRDRYVLLMAYHRHFTNNLMHKRLIYPLHKFKFSESDIQDYSTNQLLTDYVYA